MGLSALIGAFLAGLLGGVHCLAMCGGFLAALVGSSSGSRPLLPGRALTLRQLPYNLGRIATYTALGGALGALGNASVLAIDLLSVQRALFVVANLFLLALGIGIAWPRDVLPPLQRVAATLFARLAPTIRALGQQDSFWARCALGGLWGMVPCGLVYGVMPVALFAGGGIEGAAVMLAFGMGTLPNLMAAGWLVSRTRTWLGAKSVRYAAATLLTFFAVLGIWRALLGPMAAGQGPFCLVP